MQLSLDKSIRVEPFILVPDKSFPDITKIDTIAIKNKVQCAVVSREYIDLISVIKARHNSKYNLLVEIDKNGSTFGLNKMLYKMNYNSLDGCEIGLTKDANNVELMNEMKIIDGFLKQFNKSFILRWIINTSFGNKHIENCIKAIKDSNKIKFDLIRILTPSNLDIEARLKVGNLIREGIGMSNFRIKIDAEAQEVSSINNVFFSIHASKLL